MDLCKERPEIPFSLDKKLVENLSIDFVISKGNKVVAGIEIIDEPEEFSLSVGEKMLIDMLFSAMNYDYYRVFKLDRLAEEADIISMKIKSKIK